MLLVTGLTSADFVPGMMMAFAERHVGPLLASGEWRRADGHRLDRDEDPGLYDVLAPHWTAKRVWWKPATWRRHVRMPDLRHYGKMPEGTMRAVVLIRTSLPAADA